jgi:hypothetical protein
LRAVPRAVVLRVLLRVADARLAVLRLAVACLALARLVGVRLVLARFAGARLAVLARLVVARLAVLRVAPVRLRALLPALLPALLRAPPVREPSPRDEDVPALVRDVPLRALPERDEEVDVLRVVELRDDVPLPAAAPSAEAAVDRGRRRAVPDALVFAWPAPAFPPGFVLPDPLRTSAPACTRELVMPLTGVLSSEDLERVAIRKLLVAGVLPRSARIRHTPVPLAHQCENIRPNAAQHARTITCHHVPRDHAAVG